MIQILEQTKLTLRMQSGKRIVNVSFSRESEMVSVFVETHRAWVGNGKHCTSWDAAMSLYKSKDAKEAIEFARQYFTSDEYRIVSRDALAANFKAGVFDVYKGDRFVGCGDMEYCTTMVIPVDKGELKVYAPI